jgi:caa(3)-type oxidase subunit IV
VSTTAAPRRPYLVAFAALALLTAAELGVVYVPGIGRALLIAALVLLAVAKAGLVLMVFMHLGRESAAWRRSVIGALLLPAVLAFALMADAAWRLQP